MACEVEVLLCSRNRATGDTLTTLRLRYWRAIHAELMTHRKKSRNAGSSRAIPVKKMLASVWNEPAGPIHWGANQAGMQANKQLTGWRLAAAKAAWKASARSAAFWSWLEMQIGLHKQVANRITEPYQYINVIVSATSWDNFYNLRCHKDAQPEFQELAEKMKLAILAAEVRPQILEPGEWHLPWILDSERTYLSLQSQLKVSAARIARVSIEPFDGNAKLEKEFERHDLLVGSTPIHASPTEHQAVATHGRGSFKNFDGFMQYRQCIEEQRDPAKPFEAHMEGWVKLSKVGLEGVGI